MRKGILNLHLYGALVVGIFVVIIGLTGSIMAFEPELDRLTHPGLFHVEPQGKPLPASELFKAASQAYPGQRIGNMRLPQTPDDTAQFNVKGRQVSINPYTGVVTGYREGGTFLGTIHQIHLRLLLGETGSDIVTIATVVLLFLVVSGVYLWWPLKRVSVKWSAGARRVHFDLHNTAGIYSAVFLLVLGITGVVIHFDNSIEQYLHKRAGTHRTERNVSSVVPGNGAKPIDVDQAIELALREVPGTQALMVAPPSNAKGTYLVVLHFPEDLTPGGRSLAIVDQYSGKVLSRQSSRTVAMASRSIIWNRAIHTGDVFGLATKTLMSLSSLMLVVQTITGYYMWWKKLRARQGVLAAAYTT